MDDLPSPAELSRYIALCVKEDPSKDLVACFFHCVKEHAPPGTTTGVGIKVSPKPAAVIVDKHGDQFWIKVPLTRDLLQEEGETIVQAFAAKQPELDFDVRMSSATVDTLENEVDPITVDKDHYLALCTQWAKRQHQNWMKERLEQGWRYGTSVSLKDKTHPLLRPWEELPAKFRTINSDEPQTLLDLLNDQGYAVISKTELDSLFKLLRSVL